MNETEAITASTAVPMDAHLVARFQALVGPAHALTDREDTRRYVTEERGLYSAPTPLVLRPGSTEEVAAILALASETGTPIIPQGGNTGVTGAQVPLRDGPAGVIVSLSRMNRIREIDTDGDTITVEAGVVLQTLQETAREAGRLFPLSLGAQGSCQIGGNLATNAGGTAVLAFGNMRQLCLGLEVVLPTGEIWHGLRRLKKDNTGYDLRDLFIGAEGTLGIITAAVLKLFPQPRGHEVMVAGLASAADALVFFKRAVSLCGPSLTGFELMARIGVDFSVRHIEGVREPLEGEHAWYVLVDISSSRSPEDARAMAEQLFEDAFGAGLVADAVLAESDSQRAQFWHMREAMSWAQKPEGGSIKHDVSVPVAKVPAFIDAAGEAVLRRIPAARIVAFGHLGDGNIHYNISQPTGADKAAFLKRWHEINEVVHDVVMSFGGSISAEHGIGQLKRDELASRRSSIEIDLMRRIKRSFDPAGIMNPGKVIQM